MAEILGNVKLNIAVSIEHMGEVERTTSTVKERERGIVNTLPYSYLPSQIIIHLVYFIVIWLNAFLDGKGISQN